MNEDVKTFEQYLRSADRNTFLCVHLLLYTQLTGEELEDAAARVRRTYTREEIEQAIQRFQRKTPSEPSETAEWEKEIAFVREHFLN